MRRPVPLLPSPPKPVDPRTPSIVTSSDIALRERPKPVPAACEECRKRKSKCTVPWPCRPCLRRKTVCQFAPRADLQVHYRAIQRKYIETQAKTNRLESIFSMLREKPEDVSLAIFRRIRTGADAEAILKSMKGGDLLMQLHLSSASEFLYTFPYRTALPGIFAETRSEYLESLAIEAPYPEREPQTFDSQSSLDLHPPFYTPYHTANLIEPMLDGAEIADWTAVCKNKSLLHSLMEAYFQHIYSAFPFFHKDCFLQDLSSGNRRFCSSLLVNAVLAHACHATPTVEHRNEHWNPQNIGYIFLAEARRLLELETGRPKITTVQAMLVMNITMNDHGVDGAAYQYLTRAVALAEHMGLFNFPIEDMEQSVDPYIKIVREVTAWALFAWQGIMSSMLYQQPLVKVPPQTPYPDPGDFPFWYGDLWIQYPSNQAPISTKYPQTFKAYLEYWTIFNEIALVLFRPGQIQPPYLGQVVQFYARLQSWFDSLPDDLQPKKVILPFQLKLHIQYWALVMDLFKPFVGWDDFTRTLDMTPSEIYRDARTKQKHVLWLYYLRHGTETHDCWFSMFLPKLGFLALQEVMASPPGDDPPLSALILALTSLDNQGKCCFMPEFTLRTICAQMRSRDLDLFKQFATFGDLNVPKAIESRIGHIKSNWPVTMDFAKQERKNIRQIAAEAIGMYLMDDE